MSNPITEEHDFQKNIDSRMTELQDNLASIYDSHNRAFAQDLCDFYRQKQYLTAKQIYWALKFWKEAGVRDGEQPNPANYEKLPVRHKHPVEAPRVQVDGKVLIHYFDTAGKKLQTPKIRYVVKPPVYGCEELLFYRTGAGSHAPNSVGVTNGLQHPYNRILAIMYRDGRTVFFSWTFDKPEMQQLIKKVAENPLAAFSQNGKLTSNCCYCGQQLSHASSLFYGYGPICAANWGLPWGEVEASTQALQLNPGE